MERRHPQRQPDPTPEEMAQKIAEIRERREKEMLEAPKPDDQQADPMNWRPRSGK
jgi:hypothetical protein